MTNIDLERELAAARREMDRAGEALRTSHKGNEWAELKAAQLRLLQAERALAEARAEEHAVPCPGFPVWDVGAPLPHLFTEGRKASLVYLTREPDPTWDGRTANVVDPQDEELHLVAVVQFHRVHDETFECVAESFTAKTKLASLESVCRDALEELLR